MNIIDFSAVILLMYEKYNMNEVLCSSNKFFVNTGSALAGKIPEPITSNQQNYHFLKETTWKHLKRKMTKGHHLSIFVKTVL